MRRILGLLLAISLLAGCVAKPIEPTVILISIDGFRFDYLDLADTPHLDRLIATGVRAESMEPVYPANTFPNHYTIVTGLYPENHGIVDNNFYDPELDAEFGFGNPATFSESRFWQGEGEPLWVTVERQGGISAAMFWGGTNVEIGGVRPTYWHPYDGSVTNETRVDNVLAWFDLPSEERPSFVTLYMSHVDDAGHEHMPGGPETLAAAEEADRHIGRLVEGLEERGLLEVVHIVIVSDHGMTPVSEERVIYLDDYIDLANVNVVGSGSGAPIWPQPGDEDDVYAALATAHPNMSVFKKQDIPERFHYRKHRRIPPILAIADDGWTIRRARESSRPIEGGAHGYDNTLPNMQAAFVAHGPAFKKGVLVESFRNIHIYSLLTHILELEPAPNDGNLEAVEHLLER